MQERRDVVPDDLWDSRPHGFSQAVVVPSGGATVYVSGQVGWSPQDGAAGDDLASQVPVAFGNLARVLAAAGGTLDDVVALRIYVVESAGDDLAPVGDALRARFTRPPAATWIRVAGLADAAMLVEVEATAVLP